MDNPYRIAGWCPIWEDRGAKLVALIQHMQDNEEVEPLGFEIMSMMIAQHISEDLTHLRSYRASLN